MTRRFGKVRKLPSGRHQASFLDSRSGRRVTAPSTFATKTAANHWLVDMQSLAQRGELPDLYLGRVRFAEWAAQWLNSKPLKAKTLDGYEGIINTHLNPRLGRMPLNAINRSDVVELISYLSKNHSEHVAANAKTVLSSILNEAKHNGAIPKNPAEAVKVKRARRRDMVFLSRDQVARLAREIANPPRTTGRSTALLESCEQYGLLVRLAAETGLRAGEIAALRVGRVDIKNGRLHVAESAAEVSKRHSGSGLVYDEPKTYERRSVPLPASLVTELVAHLANRPSEPTAFVFTAPRGAPLRHRNFYRYLFKPAVLRAGLPSNTRFHDLRHTFAALLIEAGGHPLSVKNRMGHSSIKVTYDRYGHLFPHMEEDLTTRMNAAYTDAQQLFGARSVHEPDDAATGGAA